MEHDKNIYYIGRHLNYDEIKDQIVIRNSDDIKTIHKNDPNSVFIRKDKDKDNVIVNTEFLAEHIKYHIKNNIDPCPKSNDWCYFDDKEDGRIDWNKPVDLLDAFIRGMTPWPGAFTYHDDKRLKIHSAKPVPTDVDDKPGTVVKGFPDELRIATGRGVLSVLEIQAESGRRLPIKDFLKGFRMPPGTLVR